MGKINAIRLGSKKRTTYSNNHDLLDLKNVTCKFQIEPNGSGKLIFELEITKGMKLLENVDVASGSDADGCNIMLEPNNLSNSIPVIKKDVFLLIKPDLIDAELAIKIRLGAQSKIKGLKAGQKGTPIKGSDDEFLLNNVF